VREREGGKKTHKRQKIQTEKLKFVEGEGTNLGGFIRNTSFSYSSPLEVVADHSISIFLFFQKKQSTPRTTQKTPPEENAFLTLLSANPQTSLPKKRCKISHFIAPKTPRLNRY
jgi:hypothetical protein